MLSACALSIGSLWYKQSLMAGRLYGGRHQYSAACPGGGRSAAAAAGAAALGTGTKGPGNAHK